MNDDKVQFIRTIIQPDEGGGSGYPIGVGKRWTRHVEEFFDPPISRGELPPPLTDAQVEQFDACAKHGPAFVQYRAGQLPSIVVKLGEP